MKSSKGQVERDETAVSEEMRKGEEGVGWRSAKDRVGPQHTHLEKSSRCGRGLQEMRAGPTSIHPRGRPKRGLHFNDSLKD